MPAARARISSATLSPVLGVSPVSAITVAVARERWALSSGWTRRSGISVVPSSTQTRVGIQQRISQPHSLASQIRRNLIEDTAPLHGGIVADQPLDFTVKALFQLVVIFDPSDLVGLALPDLQWCTARQ